MQVNKKIMLHTILSLLVFLLSSCSFPQGPVEVILPSGSTVQQQVDSAVNGPASNDSVAKRFQESTSQGPTAVESAIELSEKYAKLSEEAAVLRQENLNFITENHRLKDQSAALESQLQQAQKELTEANDLLIEMRIELNNWKTNVLGFRDEMRSAEKAQLEALLKILNILGGEVKAKSNQDENTGSVAASPDEPNRSQP